MYDVLHVYRARHDHHPRRRAQPDDCWRPHSSNVSLSAFGPHDCGGDDVPWSNNFVVLARFAASAQNKGIIGWPAMRIVTKITFCEQVLLHNSCCLLQNYGIAAAIGEVSANTA